MSSSMHRILVVDDDVALGRALRRALEAHGAEVTVAASCAEARAGIRAAPVDLAVLDLELPDGRGDVLSGELLAAWPAARVVFFTGGASDAALRGADRLGPVVEKPNVAGLLRCVLHVIRAEPSATATDAKG